ncbi:MAG: hypothetical protein H0U18_07995 [Pyrinomonadaceae bacterium]|nr:hypothetical protein [Pyrinomonadaceae bacterium]
MANDCAIITNRQPRNLLSGYELTAAERRELHYIDWTAETSGGDFFRYKGQIYDVDEFTPAQELFGSYWHGYQSDSFFSGILFRFADEHYDSVIVGRYYC